MCARTALLAFGDIGVGVTTITYRIRATNRGTYAIPPVQAEANVPPENPRTRHLRPIDS